MFRALRWTSTVALLTCAAIAIALLIAELSSAGAARGHAAPSEEATSLAISWILTATLALVVLVGPWGHGPHNYGARIGLGFIVWIASAGFLVTALMHAPRELRVLGIWHASTLGILIVALLRGMVGVALAQRRRSRELVHFHRAMAPGVHRAIGASATTL